MITGDGALTAAAVARRVGLLHAPPKQTLVLTQRRLTTSSGGESPSTNSRGEKNSTELVWRPLVGGFDQSSASNGSAGSSKSVARDSSAEVLFDPRSCSDLVASGKQLVVTGDALSYLLGTTMATAASDEAIAVAASPGEKGEEGKEGSTMALEALCSHVSVFARVAPAQKAAVVAALNSAGHYTLMCGDGKEA